MTPTMTLSPEIKASIEDIMAKAVEADKAVSEAHKAVEAARLQLWAAERVFSHNWEAFQKIQARLGTDLLEAALQRPVPKAPPDEDHQP